MTIFLGSKILFFGGVQVSCHMGCNTPQSKRPSKEKIKCTLRYSMLFKKKQRQKFLRSLFVLFQKIHCLIQVPLWKLVSAIVLIGSLMLDSFLTLLNLSTICVYYVVTSFTVQFSKKAGNLHIRVGFYSYVFVGFRVCVIQTRIFSWLLLLKVHVLPHTIFLKTLNVRTNGFGNRK